ncbi:MAG: hypothetical protein JXP34_10170 [Planctomycetes bacterium]|nr:hypothetical protein [Planctomycetota bacterium]
MAKDREKGRRHGHAPQADAPPETTHLDETVTKAVVASAGFFKRYRTILIVAGATILAVIVGRALYVEARDARVERLENEADRLTHPEDAEAEPEYEAIADLVARCKGTQAEREILQTAANYLWDRRDPTALRKAREYAQRAKEHFPEDKEVQDWTDGMLAAIQETLDFQRPVEAFGPPAPVRTEPAKESAPAPTPEEETEPSTEPAPAGEKKE